MPVLDELAAKLVTDGVGVLGTTIGLGTAMPIPVPVGEPGGPAFFINLRETGGTGAVRTQQNALQRPSVQLLARGRDYQTVRTALKAAYDSLGGANGLHNILLSGTPYIHVVARQEPTDLGLDPVGSRVMISFNVDVEKSPS